MGAPPQARRRRRRRDPAIRGSNGRRGEPRVGSGAAAAAAALLGWRARPGGGGGGGGGGEARWGMGERRRERGEKGRRERERVETERRRGGEGWETGCLQLSCGSVGAEPPALAGPTPSRRGTSPGCVIAGCTRPHIDSIPPQLLMVALLLFAGDQQTDIGDDEVRRS